jgi:hypothetical protein
MDVPLSLPRVEKEPENDENDEEKKKMENRLMPSKW